MRCGDLAIICRVLRFSEFQHFPFLRSSTRTILSWRPPLRPTYYIRKDLECTSPILPSTRTGKGMAQVGLVKKSFSPGKWKLRTNESKHWPHLHLKRVTQLTESLAAFLTSGRAVKYSNAHKLTITVHIPPTKGGMLLAVPHPPLWNHNTNPPVIPGSYFPLLYVCLCCLQYQGFIDLEDRSQVSCNGHFVS
jgi:hypothetical protein